MKTRINVVVRIRPLLPTEETDGDTANYVQTDEPKNAVKYFLLSFKN